MTITPGSLDYLYYNGIIDHIPYEAYELLPASRNSQQTGLSGLPPHGSLKQTILGDSYINGQQAQNNSNYLDTAMKGEMYGNNATSYDSFTGTTSRDVNQSNSYTKSQKMSDLGYNEGLMSTANGMTGANSMVNSNGVAGYGQSAYGNNSLAGGMQSMDGYNISNNGEPYPKYSLYNNYGYNNGNKHSTISTKKEKNGTIAGIIKWILILGSAIGGICLLSKGNQAQTTSFWTVLKNWFVNGKGAKLNPKNWFSGKGTKLKSWFKKIGTKVNPKNWKKNRQPKANKNKGNFWSKLNPKNWRKKNGNKTP